MARQINVSKYGFGLMKLINISVYHSTFYEETKMKTYYGEVLLNAL